jgi:hypothetical protein
MGFVISPGKKRYQDTSKEGETESNDGERVTPKWSEEDVTKSSNTGK